MMRFLIISIFTITFFSFCKHNKAPETKGIDYVSVSELDKLELRALKTNMNDVHIIEAHKSKLKTPIVSKEAFYENEEMICKKAKLEKIATNKLYGVSRLTHSLPYVNENTEEFLTLLGKRMKASFEKKGISHYKFMLTSVLRTEKDQRQLQKVNLNATPKETSHYFATTFDISQTRFTTEEGESVYSYRLRNLLARELIKLQEEGECYVILESRQKCFHITVRQ